jgi:hypothetical protein
MDGGTTEAAITSSVEVVAVFFVVAITPTGFNNKA